MTRAAFAANRDAKRRLALRTRASAYSQLDAYLRVTEGLPLQDDVFTWLVRSFSACPRPRGTSFDAYVVSTTGARRRHGMVRQQQAQHQRHGQRAPAGNGGGGDEPASLGLCLTKRGFLEMYQYIWQAARRDVEVKRAARLDGGVLICRRSPSSCRWSITMQSA